MPTFIIQVRKLIIVEKKGANLSKTLFLSKEPCFLGLFIKNEFTVKILADIGSRSRHSSFINPNDALAYCLNKVRAAMQENSRVIGNFGTRNKTATTELNIFLPKKNFCSSSYFLKFMTLSFSMQVSKKFLPSSNFFQS